MKLLLFSTYFPNRNNPVRGVFNLQQVLALSKRCEVRVAAPIQWFPVQLWHGAGPNDAPQKDVIEGVRTWHPRYFLTPRVARDGYAVQMAAALLPRLAQIRKEYPFDAMLATWAFPDLVVGAMAAKLWNIPLLAKVHGSDINVQAGFPRRRKQIKWALDRAHRVLAVSGALRERLLEMGIPDERIMVHHNGVDTELFQPRNRVEARRALGIPEGGKHALFVGYLSESKAVHVLLEALARLGQAGKRDFTTHLVGCGPLLETMKARAAELNLGDSVRFYGRRPHEEIPTWMAAADLFCLPSIREGCPNVLLEAFASGRPAVATRVGGIPEVTSERNAVLVPPSNPEQLATALRWALDREWDAEQLRATVSGFSWESSADALFQAAQEAHRTIHSPGNTLSRVKA